MGESRTGTGTETKTANLTTGGETTRLLMPLDGTEEAKAAVPYALALATPGTTLMLLTVVAVAGEVTGMSDDPLAPSAQMLGVDQARSELENVAQGLRGLGHTVQTEVAVGDPTERILQTATDLGVSMVVMSSHGRGAIGRLLYGGIADRVAREATVPVMIVRVGQVEPGPVGITRLVVPLDGSTLAEAALPVAAAISHRLGTSIVLLQAVNPIDLMPPAVGMAEAVPPEIYEETEAQMETDARAYLERVAKGLREQGLPVVTEVRTGPPAATIIDATHFGDVVVLCSHERSGIMRLLLGSVVEQLVRGDQSPVIYVPASAAAQAG